MYGEHRYMGVSPRRGTTATKPALRFIMNSRYGRENLSDLGSTVAVRPASHSNLKKNLLTPRSSRR
jgi:hypothetical protein